MKKVVLYIGLILALPLEAQEDRYLFQSKEEKSTTEDHSPWHNLSTWVEAFIQSIAQVRLTESSLQKAAESERMAMDKYREGRISSVSHV